MSRFRNSRYSGNLRDVESAVSRVEPARSGQTLSNKGVPEPVLTIRVDISIKLRTSRGKEEGDAVPDHEVVLLWTILRSSNVDHG